MAGVFIIYMCIFMLNTQESEAEVQYHCYCDIHNNSLRMKVLNVKGKFCVIAVALNAESYRAFCVRSLFVLRSDFMCSCFVCFK